MARAGALAAAVAAALLALTGASGAATQPTPKRGGTIVVGLPALEPACLNVLDSRCDTGWPSVLQPAYAFAADLTARPVLVSGVDYTRQQPFTLTYHIRPEAHWSDGVPVTARDFVFTLKAIRRSDVDEVRTAHSVVQSIRAVDPKTVRAVLRQRYAGWRQLFPFVLPEHALRREDLREIWSESIDDPRIGRPIGSGPFLFGSWDRGKQLTFVRNPRYWGPHTAYVDRLVVRFPGTPKERADGLRSGSLTTALGLLPGEFSGLRGNPRLRLDAYPGLGAEHLELRLGPGGNPLLRQKLVRRALAYAIDRVALVRQVYGDVVPNPTPLDSMVLPAQARYYEPNFGEYRSRPAYARQLLEQAGCRRGGDAVYRCGGERLALRIVTTAGIPVRAQALEILQRQLLDIGVDVTLAYVPPVTLFSPGGVLDSGEFDVALFSWVFTVDQSLGDVFGCGGSQNFSGYCQRLVTSDLDQADRILDARQRARVLNRAGRQIARDVPMIPLYSFVLTGGHSSRLRGYVFNQDDPLWSAEDWWLAPAG